MSPTPVDAPAACPYCGAPTAVREDRAVYQKSYGRMVLMCTRYPRCSAFVTCHDKTGAPMGTMADHKLRYLRKRVHALFDPIWIDPHGGRRGRGRERAAAYEWFARALGMPEDQCHVALFDTDACHRAIEVLESRQGSTNIPVDANSDHAA